MTTDEVVSETAKDPTFTVAVTDIINNEWRTNGDDANKSILYTFFQSRYELWLEHNAGIILKKQVILQETLQVQAVKVVHTRHKGIVRTIVRKSGFGVRCPL